MAGLFQTYVVDDEASIRHLICHLLSRNGFAVQAFSTAEAFRQAVDPSQPYLLVTDKNLPGDSGIRLIEQLRQEGHPFEAILITAYADMGSAVDAVRLGLYSYLPKPFNLQTLVTDLTGAAKRLAARAQAATPPALKAERDALPEARPLPVESLIATVSSRVAGAFREQCTPFWTGDAPAASVVVAPEVAQELMQTLLMCAQRNAAPKTAVMLHTELVGDSVEVHVQFRAQRSFAERTEESELEQVFAYCRRAARALGGCLHLTWPGMNEVDITLCLPTQAALEEPGAPPHCCN
ncbi:MAG: response regulator [Deltaproteobacteria bacterium]|nr:response regulator [Deltaproteobacteria bacterium]